MLLVDFYTTRPAIQGHSVPHVDYTVPSRQHKAATWAAREFSHALIQPHAPSRSKLGTAHGLPFAHPAPRGGAQATGDLLAWPGSEWAAWLGRETHGRAKALRSAPHRMFRPLPPSNAVRPGESGVGGWRSCGQLGGLCSRGQGEEEDQARGICGQPSSRRFTSTIPVSLTEHSEAGTIIWFIFWLHWVFSVLHGFSLCSFARANLHFARASGGHSSLRCVSFLLQWLLRLQLPGSRCTALVAVAHRLNCSVARGILPEQGSNPCPLRPQAESHSLCHQGSLRPHY